ncbi:MAG: hypothetical protein M3N53_15190 [Actinomycetota bacterium]|nr:hypothetical protein [Actinomycetota bacterium]
MASRLESLGNIREKAMELGVYLPLGAYSKVRDELSDLNSKRVRKAFDGLIERGEDRLEPVERLIRRRARQAEKRVDEVQRDVAKTARKTTRRATAAADTVAPKLPRVAAPKKASELPIKGYAGLTASDIVSELRGLTQTELAKVYKWERAHENRSTILDAIDSKFVELPIPTYDALNVDEIVQRLDKLETDELKVIRRYEAETKDRTTVIEKIDSLI